METENSTFDLACDFSDGKQAALNELPRHSCPKFEGNYERRSWWLRGFEEGKKL